MSIYISRQDNFGEIFFFKLRFVKGAYRGIPCYYIVIFTLMDRHRQISFLIVPVYLN
jgi:hypothetical protein